MKPVLLRDDDKETILASLIRFYQKRPDEYGLMERPQSVYEHYASFIAEHITDKNTSILDLGSGSWRIPETIANYGFSKVVGLDYFSDEKLKEYRREISNPNVELATYTDENIPFENNSFEAVSSLCVLEHIVYIEKTLNEIDRVLKPGGRIIIHCPNWSGFNVNISAMKSNLLKKDRLWQYDSFFDSFFGFFRSFNWYLRVLFSSEVKFIMIYPRMKGSEIDFERSDDDVVHLCQPLSFKKYFKKKGYKIIKYNKGAGVTLYSKIINRIIPSFATTNEIVVEKLK